MKMMLFILSFSEKETACMLKMLIPNNCQVKFHLCSKLSYFFLFFFLLLFIFSAVYRNSECCGLGSLNFAAWFHYILRVFKWGYNKSKLHKTLKLLIKRYAQCSFLEKSLRIVFLHHIFCMIFQQKCFSRYVLLTDQISLSDCLYFLRYWTICVLQVLVNQVVLW